MNPQDRTRLVLRSGLDTESKVLLIAICDHMDDRDQGSWVAVSRGLLAETGLGERTLQKRVALGIGQGWLSRGGLNGHQVREWIVHWDRLPEAPRAAPPARDAGVEDTAGSAPPEPARAAPPARDAGVEDRPPHGVRRTPARRAPDPRTACGRSDHDPTMIRPSPPNPPPKIGSGAGGQEPDLEGFEERTQLRSVLQAAMAEGAAQTVLSPGSTFMGSPKRQFPIPDVVDRMAQMPLPEVREMLDFYRIHKPHLFGAGRTDPNDLVRTLEEVVGVPFPPELNGPLAVLEAMHGKDQVLLMARVLMEGKAYSADVTDRLRASWGWMRRANFAQLIAVSQMRRKSQHVNPLVCMRESTSYSDDEIRDIARNLALLTNRNEEDVLQELQETEAA